MSRGFNGKMYNVRSGHLSRVGWIFDEEKDEGVMRVEFNRGGIYDYFPVSKELNDKFWLSPTKGKFFVSEIKNKSGISYKKID